MKPSQILGITVCILLVLLVAGCTDSKTPPQQTATPEKTPTLVQPTPVQTTEQPTPVPTAKQPTPSNGQNKEIPAASGNLTIYFLDVGQGDSILLEHGADSMLIDSVEIGKGDDVAAYERAKVSRRLIMLSPHILIATISGECQ